MRPAGRRCWPGTVGYLAAAWSMAYGALGVYWSAGGRGFPFGVADRAGDLSLLAAARQETAAPVIAALGLAGMICGVAMARAVGTRFARWVLLGFAWIAAVGLAVLIPDFRVLVVVAYAPILLIGAPFDWPERVSFFDAIPWPVLNQAICVAGGLAWAATALVYQRRTRDACVYCGRRDTVPTWQTPAAARRWGTWAVVVAVIVPVVYALTRWAWALGVPLGLTDKFFREGQATGLWRIGAALGTLALIGAVLTTGLIKPWGEVFPRWVPRFSGRPVPHALVVVPVAFVSVIVTSAGLMFLRRAIAGTFKLGDNPVTFTENSAALWPELIWPLWGLALCAAALAYHYRTRRQCRYCGRVTRV
jgi:hypothetical protein